MLWGFHCRTCGKSSRKFYDSAAGPYQDLHDIGNRLEGIALGWDDETLPTLKIPVLIFLSQHSGHELWSECDAAMIRFSSASGL